VLKFKVNGCRIFCLAQHPSKHVVPQKGLFFIPVVGFQYGALTEAAVRVIDHAGQNLVRLSL
jgi:hypothetical protein